MPVICGGLMLCSAAEVNFNMTGFLYAVGAALLRAVKTLVQGALLQGDKIDSVSLLFYMAPWAGLFLQLCAPLSEGFGAPLLLLEALTGLRNDGSSSSKDAAVAAFLRAKQADSELPEAIGTPLRGGGPLLLMLLASGLNACLLNVANFQVTAYTSPVTLQVLGNVKSCLGILISVAVFRNPLTLRQAFGVAICIFGVWLYNSKGGPAVAGTTPALAAPPLPKSKVPDRDEDGGGDGRPDQDERGNFDDESDAVEPLGLTKLHGDLVGRAATQSP